MRPKTLLALCGIAAILLPLSSQAATCEFERPSLTSYKDAYTMKQESSEDSCNLKALLSEFDHVVAIKPGIQLNLPNLVVSAIDYTETFGSPLIDYAVSVEVSNTGMADARTPQVAIVVNVIGEPGSSGIDRQEVYLERLPTIAAGASVQIPVTTVSLGPARNGHTIQVIAVADPASTRQPGGEIWESDESDNDKVRNITTYGF